MQTKKKISNKVSRSKDWDQLIKIDTREKKKNNNTYSIKETRADKENSLDRKTDKGRERKNIST